MRIDTPNDRPPHRRLVLQEPGVARLGEFTPHWKFAADPKPAAAASLEEPLTELARRHGLDPPGEVLHVNPVNGERRTAPAIEGKPSPRSDR